ncbi:hypothetical protein ACHAP5_011502 [Fusarium lateritium]
MSNYAENHSSDLNVIERVAIVGASGTIGSYITEALLATRKHQITALTRKASTNNIPEGVIPAPVDYNDQVSLVAALKNQQFLIITLAPSSPKDTHSKLVRAAAEAGVSYVMPNSFAGDIDNVKLGEDIFLGPVAKAQRDEIESLGMQWITVCCGLWYDYSLAGGESRFGFDLEKRSLTLYDDGNTKNSTSTLDQVGRAVAKILSLPVLPADEAENILTLSNFINKPVYLQSFLVSQNDIFESVKRVTGTSDSDWTITHESTEKRYEDGLAQVKVGNMTGFPKLLFARAFFPEDPSVHSEKVQNELLGLPEESLDEATKAGMDLVKVLATRVERMAS